MVAHACLRVTVVGVPSHGKRVPPRTGAQVGRGQQAVTREVAAW